MFQARSLRNPRPAALLAAIALLTSMFVSVVPAAVAADAVNLGFTTFPPNPATAAAPFPVTVHVQDASAAPLNGVLVTLDIDPAHNPGGATLSCTGGAAHSTGSGGNAQFNGCTISRAASGYQLRARASGATTVNTPSFDVQVGPPAELFFSGYPASATLTNLAPQPAVAIVDAGGNVVTGDTRTITLSINKHGSTFTCTGGLSRAAVNGVATFSGCRQTTFDTGYRITANDGNGGLPAVTGPNFAVQAGLATHLQFCWSASLPCVTTPPSPIRGGVDFPTQPVVRVVDDAGNTIISDDQTVIALAIAAGTPVSGGPGKLTCNGGLSERASDGIARFTGCEIDRVGNGYRLAATSNPALPAVQSSAFNVVTGPAQHLVFVNGPPSSVTAGTPFPQPVTIAIQDDGGNVVTGGITATVRLSLGSNPGNATLACAGGLDAPTVNGVATFNGCTVSAAGTGYRLSARAISTSPSTSLSNATSSAFTVLAVGAILGLSTSPTNGVITWGGTVVLNVQFTSAVGPRTVMLQVSRDKTTWFTIATLVTTAGGSAAFGYRPSDNRYYRAVFAGAPDLSAATSPIVRVVVRQINLLRPTNGGKVRDISAGTGVSFSSTVRPARPDLPQAHVNFVVYRLINGAWTLVSSQVLAVNAAGVARLSVTFSSRASFYVRSQAVPTTFNANSVWSPVERYDVH